MIGMDLLRSQRGLVTWLAPRIGLSQSAVAMWTRIPAERARDIEEVTGIPRHLLRPDLWTPPWQTEPHRGITRKKNKKQSDISAPVA